MSKSSRRHVPLPPALLEAVARRFKVLGSESRLAILDALMARPQTTAELGEATALEQSNLSRHLAALEAEGCVRRVREGREQRLEIADAALRDLCALVCGSLRARAREEARLLRA